MRHLLGAVALSTVLAGCADEPATMWTRGGVKLECPGVIIGDDKGYACGDVRVSRAAMKSINHFGPRPWWY